MFTFNLVSFINRLFGVNICKGRKEEKSYTEKQTGKW